MRYCIFRFWPGARCRFLGALYVAVVVAAGMSLVKRGYRHLQLEMSVELSNVPRWSRGILGEVLRDTR